MVDIWCDTDTPWQVEVHHGAPMENSGHSWHNKTKQTMASNVISYIVIIIYNMRHKGIAYKK